MSLNKRLHGIGCLECSGLITNIKDNRANYAKSDNLDFVVEPSYADNSLPEATYYPVDDPSINFMYEELLKSTIAEGLAWANAFTGPVTLFIYNDLREAAKPFSSLMADDLDFTVPNKDKTNEK